MSNKNRASTFLAMIESETDDCLIWEFAISSNGYGQIWYEGKDMNVHRLALILKVGAPTNRKNFALHKPTICHNRRCFNYRHLYWGTPKDNMQDSVTDGTKTKPPRFVGVKHPMAKLTEQQVRAIRQDEDIHRVIAKKYGIAKATVTFIKSKKLWKELV